LKQGIAVKVVAGSCTARGAHREGFDASPAHFDLSVFTSARVSVVNRSVAEHGRPYPLQPDLPDSRTAQLRFDALLVALKEP
jgi:hypothetical protein